jgi:hypothetical protein
MQRVKGRAFQKRKMSWVLKQERIWHIPETEHESG